jgi:hypothetical protein
MTPDEWTAKIIQDLAYKAPELWDGHLRVTLRQAIRENSVPQAISDHWVVVTIVEDGPVHVYSRPDPMDKAEARRLERALVKSDAEMYPDADRTKVRFCVRKVLTDAEPLIDTVSMDPGEDAIIETVVEREVWGGDELIGPEEPA